jgi:hypothetical protein
VEAVGRSELSVVAGTADANDEQVVGLSTRGDVYCSGIAIAPRLILTAGHCAEVLSDRVVFGSDAMHPDAAVAVASSLEAPDYSAQTLDNDLGVVVLATLGPPVPAFNAGSAEALVPGTHVRVVGLGVTAPDAGRLGLKRQGDMVVTAVGQKTLDLAPGPANSCDGDSGGAVFAVEQGRERLVGVISSGDSECATRTRAIRVDAYLDFLSEIEEKTQDHSARAGARCYDEVNCVQGSCYDPPDAPGFAYCASPCAAEPDCPSGMRCSDGACHFDTPSPGALGATCSTSDDCSSQLCAPVGGESKLCTRFCSPEGAACPGGMGCQSMGDTSLCAAPAGPSLGETARCAVGAPGGPSSGWVGWLYLLMGPGLCRILRGARHWPKHSAFHEKRRKQ